MDFEEPNCLALREERLLPTLRQGQETRYLLRPNPKAGLERLYSYNLWSTSCFIGHDDSEVVAHELKQRFVLCNNPACHRRETSAQTPDPNLRFVHNRRAKLPQEAQHVVNIGLA